MAELMIAEPGGLTATAAAATTPDSRFSIAIRLFLDRLPLTVVVGIGWATGEEWWGLGVPDEVASNDAIGALPGAGLVQ